MVLKWQKWKEMNASCTTNRETKPTCHLIKHWKHISMFFSVSREIACFGIKSPSKGTDQGYNHCYTGGDSKLGQGHNKFQARNSLAAFITHNYAKLPLWIVRMVSGQNQKKCLISQKGEVVGMSWALERRRCKTAAWQPTLRLKILSLQVGSVTIWTENVLNKWFNSYLLLAGKKYVLCCNLRFSTPALNSVYTSWKRGHTKQVLSTLWYF